MADFDDYFFYNSACRTQCLSRLAASIHKKGAAGAAPCVGGDLQPFAVGVVSHGCRPVAEDADDADVFGEHVEVVVDVAIFFAEVFYAGEVPAAAFGNRAGAFQRPGDEFEAIFFRGFGVVRDAKFAAVVFDEHRHCR